jgi:hypothetical protein
MASSGLASPHVVCRNFSSVPNPSYPLVAAARERDREARERVRHGIPYRPSPREKLEYRAWRVWRWQF